MTRALSRIPTYRVMNWTQRGVEDGPDVPLHKTCRVRSLDANMDDRDIPSGAWERAVSMCQRVVCVCAGES